MFDVTNQIKKTVLDQKQVKKSRQKLQEITLVWEQLQKQQQQQEQKILDYFYHRDIFSHLEYLTEDTKNIQKKVQLLIQEGEEQLYYLDKQLERKAESLRILQEEKRKEETKHA